MKKNKEEHDQEKKKREDVQKQPSFQRAAPPTPARPAW